MKCSWHAQNPFHDDSPYTGSASASTSIPKGRNGGECSADTGPGCVEIPAGRGAQWHFAADEPHSTCQPGEIGEDVLLLSQLWQNHSPQMNLVHYSLTVILIHTFILKLPVSKLLSPHTRHVLYTLFDCIFKSNVRQFYK